MWLLNTRTAILKEFQGTFGIRYAILSHVWQKEEQTFEEVRAIGRSYPAGALVQVSEKIRRCCEVAARDGYHWVWIDTCCIDKSSSSQLSEAINSMYAWYGNAAICYAYLHDTNDVEDPLWHYSSFRQSKWFTRGWTLQELLAPRSVVFLSTEWFVIGTKQTLAKIIEEITGIHTHFLVHARPLHEANIARRMSWASKRRTTREEDRAYSLMGIFGVHIPTIYGEGAHAFRRLQEEILRRSPDQSIFTWGVAITGDPLAVPDWMHFTLPPADAPRALLASSPEAFQRRGTHTESFSYGRLAQILEIGTRAPPECRLTSYGIRAEFPLVRLPSCPWSPTQYFYCAVLQCESEHGELAVLFLHRTPDTVNECSVGASMTFRMNAGSSEDDFSSLTPCRVAFVPPSVLKTHFIGHCILTDLVLPAFDSPTSVTRALSAPALEPDITMRPCRFAYFVPRRVLGRFAAGGFFLDREACAGISFPERDGYEGVVLEFRERDGRPLPHNRSADNLRTMTGASWMTFATIATTHDTGAYGPVRQAIVRILCGWTCHGSCDQYDHPWFEVVVDTGTAQTPSKPDLCSGTSVPDSSDTHHLPCPPSSSATRSCRCAPHRVHWFGFPGHEVVVRDDEVVGGDETGCTLVFRRDFSCAVTLRVQQWKNCHLSFGKTFRNLYILDVTFTRYSSV